MPPKLVDAPSQFGDLALELAVHHARARLKPRAASASAVTASPR
jgi:hypothetical protein